MIRSQRSGLPPFASLAFTEVNSYGFWRPGLGRRQLYPGGAELQIRRAQLAPVRPSAGGDIEVHACQQRLPAHVPEKILGTTVGAQNAMPLAMRGSNYRSAFKLSGAAGEFAEVGNENSSRPQ